MDSQNQTEKEKLLKEIFDYFNANPSSTFVEISKSISTTCTPNKVRRLLLEQKDKVLDNGRTVEEQLKLKKYEQEKFLKYVYSNPNFHFMDIVNETGISIDKVRHYLGKYSDYVLCNGNTITKQRIINKAKKHNELALKKKKIVDYLKNNPESTYKDLERVFSISNTTISEYLDEFQNDIVPSTGLTIKEQIEENRKKFIVLRDKILNYYYLNPKSTFVEIANLYNCSKEFVRNVMQENLEFKLSNGNTIKQQIEINNPSVDEELIVRTFKQNPTISLRQLAKKIDSELDIIRNYLYKHVDDVLYNGLTIGEQLDYNKRYIWHKKEDTIPDTGVFIRDENGAYRCLVSEIEGMKFDLYDTNGDKIGTINVSNDLEEKVVKQFLRFYLKGNSISEYIKENELDSKEFNDSFTKIKYINNRLFGVINERIKINRKNFIGPVNFYDTDIINEIIIFMISNNLDYDTVCEFYSIDSVLLKQLLKRGDKDLLDKLEEKIKEIKNNKK